MYYWKLTTKEGVELDIPPEAVETVKRRMSSGEPIHTSSMTIPANQIKSFQQTSKRFGEPPLLDAAAQAFDEVMEGEDGVFVRWVKKPVSQTEYNRHYAAIPGYKKIGQEGGMVMVAFRVPIHLIDLKSVEYASDTEL